MEQYKEIGRPDIISDKDGKNNTVPEFLAVKISF